VKVVDPEAIRIEAPLSHSRASRAASVMFAVMIGRFPAISGLIRAGNRPRFAQWRSFRRCLDTFQYSEPVDVWEIVQTLAKTAPGGDHWTVSGRQIGQDCREVSTLASEHRRSRRTCPLLLSMHIDPGNVMGSGAQ
jgi:hypothetical protein